MTEDERIELLAREWLAFIYDEIYQAKMEVDGQ